MLRRGLHIDDDDEPEKYEYGGTCLLTKVLLLIKRKEISRRILTPCSLEDSGRHHPGEDQPLKTSQVSK